MKTFLLIIALLVGSISFANAAAKPLRICAPDNTISALFYVGQSKGFFKPSDFEFIHRNNGKLCQDAVLAKAADIANTAEGPFTYLAAQNPPIRIIAVHQISPETAIFARGDRGIVSPSDLKGKKIGVLPGTVSYFFLYRFLKHHGMTMQDIETVTLQVPAMGAALQGGQVDAISVWQPWGYNALASLTPAGVSFMDGEIYSWHAPILASDDAIENKKPQIQEMIRVMLKTEKFMAENPEETKKIIADQFKLPLAFVSDMWPLYTNKLFLDNSTIELMEGNFKILQESQEDFKAAPMPDFHQFVDPSFIKDIAPERLTYKHP
jgi:NitT/TauT family transport system substrate-binding protein